VSVHAKERLAQRLERHRPNPAIATGLSAAPFVAALALAMMMDMFVGPALGATWAKIITDVGIAIVLAGSLNVVNGFAGQFSIGHAGFMMVGGYAAAWLTYYGSIQLWGKPDLHGGFLGDGQQLFLAGCILGGLVAAVFGVVVGLPSLRLRGDYLAIVTLGFGEIVRVLGQITAPQPKVVAQVANRSMLELADNLGGAEGFSQIPPYTRLFFVYMFAFVLLVLVYRLKYSSKGRALLAVRENEIAAEAMGVDTTRAKVVAFVFAAFFAGIGGALYAHQIQNIQPSELAFSKSIELVIMVVIGGMGSITGTVLGAFVVVTLPEVLRTISSSSAVKAMPTIFGDILQSRMVVFALALVLVMLLRPQGIMGVKELWETEWWRKLVKKVSRG